MPKSLVTYRDNARAEYGDEEIIAAFPVWRELEDTPLTPAEVAEASVAAAAGFFGLIGVVVGTIGSFVVDAIRRARGRSNPDSAVVAPPRGGPATMLVRPDRIDIHELSVETLKPRAHAVAHPVDERVRIGDMRLGRGQAALIELGTTRWQVRRRHERALRNQLTGLGFRIEPLPTD